MSMSRAAHANRWNHVSMIAAILIVLTMVGGGLIGANSIRIFSELRTTWQKFDTVSEQKISYLTTIHAYLGYSGLAQHMKNYLLHNNERDLSQIDIDLDQSKNAIDSYRLLHINADEATALNALHSLVLKARRQTVKIPQLRAQGLTPAEIDTRIDLNPDAAIAALNQLHWAWRQQAHQTKQAMERTSREGTTMVKLGWIFLPVMATLGAIVFYLFRRLCHQVIAYEREKTALEASERQFRDMAANVPGVVFQWFERTGGERGYLYVSPRCQELYGVSPEELKRDWHALTLHPEDEERYHTTIESAFKKRAEWSFEGRFLTPDGTEKWGRCLSRPVLGAENDEIIFNGVMIDISTQKKMEEDLRVLATTDALTGAKNRRSFLHTADTELVRASRYAAPVSVLMIDLDHFKKVNDTHGHPAGDEVLRHFTTIVNEHLRATDVLGRIGGEEFAVLLPETDATGANSIAERIRLGLTEMVIPWEGQTIQITASVGIATLGQCKTDIHGLLSCADKALYIAKTQGRNQVVIGSPPTDISSPSTRPDVNLSNTKPGSHGAN